LVEVAGRPVLEHIMLNLAQNGINELVLVVGHLKDKLMDWIIENFSNRFKLHFVEQRDLLGLGHAVYQAGTFLDDEEVIVMLGDEIFSKNYSKMIEDCKKDADIDAAIGTMVVRDPTHYGMLTVGKDGYVTRMVEKPKEFEGNLALAGAYYFKRGRDIFVALQHIINQERKGKEYQLTDALQHLVETGSKIVTFAVGEGYDCGRPESLLLSNRRMLVDKHFVDETAIIEDSEIIDPCHIGPNVRVLNSKIGPYVSMGQNAIVDSSVLSDVIVESGTVVKDVTSSDSILSGDAKINLRESIETIISRVDSETSQTHID
jgi:glucose-1-phosphate thymidylyltransferase